MKRTEIVIAKDLLQENGYKIIEPKEQKLLKIPELNIEVTKIQDWIKPYNEIVIPKGFRLIEDYELMWLIRKATTKFLGKYKGEYNYFWIAQTPYVKANNYSSGLYLNGNLGLYLYDDGLSDSDEDGRVVFVRDLK